MIGDVLDFISRLKDVLPRRWFPDDSPLLDTLLTGLATGWTWVYGQVGFVRSQARISTAEGIWLDLSANDYFGTRLNRRPGQQDATYRQRILLELVREHATRAAVAAALHDTTGQWPVLFEPANPLDTGGYGSAGGSGTGFAYGAAGGWGSVQLPFQFFVTAFRPPGSGIAAVSGWNSQNGGYGTGTIEYASLTMVPTQITDADILRSIADVLPVATIAWTRITNQ